ncbi:mucin-22-like [Stegostoma tigrinum]|uniref:mucin-22-like n=1 Tax=Stegostoma tigrinum TaxID=3053191 RepID=UPI0028705036|nr:mucin-22-like [Stegostoma tigrinum]
MKFCSSFRMSLLPMDRKNIPFSIRLDKSMGQAIWRSHFLNDKTVFIIECHNHRSIVSKSLCLLKIVSHTHVSWEWFSLVEAHLNKANMKWQHYPKMSFHLFTILVTIGGLLGTPVDEDILDRLISINTSEDLRLLSRSHSVHALSTTKSTVTDNGKQELLHTDLSPTATVGLSNDYHEAGNILQNKGMESASEETSTSSKHLVTEQPTEMIASSLSHARNTQTEHLNLVSTKSLLSESPIGSTTELSSGDEKPAWQGRLTPTTVFSTQSPFWYMGSSLPSVQDLPSSSVLDSALPSDQMELRTISSEGAESSTYKSISAEQTVTPRTESTTESIHVFSPESVVANATSMTSAKLEQLSTSWSAGSSGSLGSARGNHWQDASMDIYSTAISSSTRANWSSPDASEDVYSTAASSGTSWPSPDAYSTSASSGTSWPSPDASEDVHSTAASSSGTSWPSPDASEDAYPTAASSVETSWPSPDASEDEYSTSASSSVRTSWPSPDASKDAYPTAASSVETSWPSLDVSEDVRSTAASSSVGTSWPSPDASKDAYPTAASSVETSWPSLDVSEDVRSTAASSSVGTSWPSPDASKDAYPTAASSGTSWPSPDASEDVYSTAASSVETSWPSLDVSEDVRSTAASSSVGTSWTSPDASEDEYSTAASSSVRTSWPSPDASKDAYPTAASSGTSWPSPDASEDVYSTAASSVETSWPSLDVSEDVRSTAASSSVGTSWTSPDASEDVYLTAASSVETSWPSPDASKDAYSTAASSVGTSWPSLDVSEVEHCNSVAASRASAAEFSTALPYTQLSISEEIASTNEFPGVSEYFSITSSSPNFQPSASGALSVSSYWEPNTSEELSTSVDITNYVAPETSSVVSSYMKPSESGMQLFTMVTAARKEPEDSSSIESSKTASYTHISVIRNPLLLQFDILDQNYTDDLSNKSSEAYKELEIVVKAMLDPIFSARYGDSFLETKILNFVNGSVKVKSELVFQKDAVLPSSSDVVRTVLTHVYRKDLAPTDLDIDANSVVCNGYSLANLVPERVTIEFTALSTGFGPWSDDSTFYPELLEHLENLVVETLEEKYLVQEFNITRSIRIQGDVNLQATALLITSVHVDDVEVLQLLSNLVNNSVDLRSLKVNGSGVNVGVLPISFLITNWKYNSTLRDSRSAYFCSLGKAVTRALQMILQPNYGHFMQAVIKQFGRGSVFVTSDLVFLNNLPTSHEVLDLFFNSIDSRSVLAGTDFAVDPYSFFVGGARLDRPYERIHFPGFGIAIILLCGLAIVSLPILAFLCWKYRFCAACQKSFAFAAWDVERENASNIPLPEVNPESYRLREPTYVNYSFNS